MSYPTDRLIDLDALTLDDEAFLADLQGNILKGHGREHAGFLFFSIADVDAARTFLTTYPVTSARQQLEEVATFKATCGKEPGGVFRAFLVSASGYWKFGKAEDEIPSDPTFRDGSKAGALSLGDPDVFDWQEGFQGDIDGLFIVSHHDEETLTDEMLELRHAVDGWGTVLAIEEGLAYKNANGDGVEHFGYVDGRSQPLMIVQDVEVEKFCKGGIDQFDPSANLDLVVEKDPLAPAATAFGSYFVFRKLEQNVKAFKDAEDELAEDLMLFGLDAERAGAMVIGRFEDGTPLEMSPDDGLNCPVSNNFNYQSDPDGLRCPLQGHIRKTNPRRNAEERGRRMARRGITYGQRALNPDKSFADKPTGDVGLLFMAYQKSIVEQFEVIQKFWANRTDFERTGAGPDPVIGQGPEAEEPQTWRPYYDSADQPLEKPFHGHVRMRGGEYFFAPALSAIPLL